MHLRCVIIGARARARFTTPTAEIMGRILLPAVPAVLLVLHAGTAGAAPNDRAGGDSVAAAAITDAGPVVRDAAALAPEFRARLERVLERMRREFGAGVAVVETRRSQERQDALYAQGRTRSGPVVTWTRNSAHLGGYAADVVIGGAHGGGSAYTRLATIAAEEGLRTLGPRDPGHVELPGAAGRRPSAQYAQWAGGRTVFTDAAPTGSARAVPRIVSSNGIAPAEPTVFANSPYAPPLAPGASFLSSEPRDDSAPPSGDVGDVGDAAVATNWQRVTRTPH